MALESGQHLLHYRLVEKIGEGGMGVVWRARDTDLDRDVAIKVLPDAFAADADRVARFKREAKVLATLNHHGIAGIYGLHAAAHGGPDGELRFLAMELVPGEDLSQRLARGGAFPVDEALEISARIATALAAAHAGGIVHRDLKPANIKLTPEHDVKVLDFGLAKPSAAEATSGPVDIGMSPTMTSAGSMVGMIMGTAAYMAPEQARGRAVDQRADLWAVGVILFEMLTGKAAFPGEDISEVLAGVIKCDLDWNALPASLPRSARLALRRCLERNPDERLHSAADLRILLDEGRRELDRAPDETVVPQSIGSKRAGALPWLLLVAATVALLVSVWRSRVDSDGAVTAAPVAFQVEAPEGGKFALSLVPHYDLMPDGRTIVFSAVGADGVRRLYARDLDAVEAKPIAGTEDGETPFIAADGTIAFVARSQLRSARRGVSSSTEICDIADAFYGGSFARDGSIVFTDDFDSGLKRVSGPGAEVEVLTEPDRANDEVRHGRPYVLPGGRGVVFTIEYSGRPDAPEGWYATAVLDLDTGAISTLEPETKGPYRLLPDGYLLMRQDARLIALPFDEQSLSARGDKVNVFGDGDVHVETFVTSNDGTLVYSPDSIWVGQGLFWIDRDGNELPIVEGSQLYNYPSLSNDDKRLSLSQQGQIWIYDLDDGRRIRLTQQGKSIVSLFSPDASRVAFGSYQPDENLYWMATDGGEMELLLEYANRQYPLEWDEAGARLLLQFTDPQSGYDIWTVDLNEDHAARPLLDSPHNERWSSLSPDGRYLAYASDESGRYEVYVVSYPSLRGKRAVSIDGGIEPRWSPRGDEIFFKAGGSGELFRPWTEMMAAAVRMGDSLKIATPLPLFQGTYVSGNCCGYTYDVSADARRFVMTKGAPESRRRLTVVIDALADLDSAR